MIFLKLEKYVSLADSVSSEKRSTTLSSVRLFVVESFKEIDSRDCSNYFRN